MGERIDRLREHQRRRIEYTRREGGPWSGRVYGRLEQAETSLSEALDEWQKAKAEVARLREALFASAPGFLEALDKNDPEEPLSREQIRTLLGLSARKQADEWGTTRAARLAEKPEEDER